MLLFLKCYKKLLSKGVNILLGQPVFCYHDDPGTGKLALSPHLLWCNECVCVIKNNYAGIPGVKFIMKGWMGWCWKLCFVVVVVVCFLVFLFVCLFVCLLVGWCVTLPKSLRLILIIFKSLEFRELGVCLCWGVCLFVYFVCCGVGVVRSFFCVLVCLFVCLFFLLTICQPYDNSYS